MKTFQLKIKGSIYYFSNPLIIGIINVTNDSFFKGSRITEQELILKKGIDMINSGANIIEIGGYSTRPGNKPISNQEEIDRLIPALEILHNNLDNVIISVDTFRKEVLIEANKIGFDIVNDISAGTLDESFLPYVAQIQKPYILMHFRGTPQTMQNFTNYNHVTQDVIYELSRSLNQLKLLGIQDVIIDPGFGFAKTIPQNYQLLRELESFTIFDCPILVGISRKSMIYKPLKTNPQDALTGSIALHTLALQNGANIIRTHDVKETKQTIEIMNLYQQEN